MERQLCVQSRQSVLLHGSGKRDSEVKWRAAGETARTIAMGCKRQSELPCRRAKGPEDWDSAQLWCEDGALGTKIYSRAKQGPAHVVEPVTAKQDSKFPLPQARLVLAERERGGCGWG